MTNYNYIPDPEHPRLPIVLLIDTSESMQRGGKMDLINECLKRLKEVIRCDELADKRIELAIISFGNRVEIIRDFSRIRENPELPLLVTKGSSQLGNAIMKAIKCVDDRKTTYKENALEYYRPIMLLIAGSMPIDMPIDDNKWSEVIKTVHEGEANRNFRFFTFCLVRSQSPLPKERILKEPADVGWDMIGPEDDKETIVNILKLIAPPNRPPIELANFKFQNLFFWPKDTGPIIEIDEPENRVPLLNSWTDNWSRTLFFEPEQQCEERAQVFYRILGSSAIGSLHIKNAIPCQDAYAYEVLLSEAGVIAVADGLGSAVLSDFGARHAVDTAIKTVKELMGDTAPDLQNMADVVKKSVYSARKVLEQKAIEFQCKLRDLACTLIVIVMHKHRVVVAHVGDGAVIGKTGKGLELISAPADSEYANEVSPLTGKDWEDSLRISRKDADVFAIMAFTDGLQRAALKKTSEGLTPSAGFCAPLFLFADEAEDLKEAEKDLKSFLLSEKFKYFEDDKALVIAVSKHTR